MNEDMWIEISIKKIIESGADINIRLEIIKELIESYHAMKTKKCEAKEGLDMSKTEDYLVIKPMESNDNCEREDCDGIYKYSFNGGGTCNKCGHGIPCF